MNLDLLEFKRNIEIKDGLRSSTAGSYVQMIDRFFRDANKPTSAVSDGLLIGEVLNTCLRDVLLEIIRENLGHKTLTSCSQQFLKIVFSDYQDRDFPRKPEQFQC